MLSVPLISITVLFLKFEYIYTNEMNLYCSILEQGLHNRLQIVYDITFNRYIFIICTGSKL